MSGNNEPIGHRYAENEYYDRQYAGWQRADSPSVPRSYGGGPSASSASGWRFRWGWAVLLGIIGMGVAGANPGTNPVALGIVFAVLGGVFGGLIEWLLGMAVIGFIIWFIAKAAGG